MPPRGRLLLFFDYDTQWGADRSRGRSVADWGAREFDGTDQVLELLASFAMPACFAVVGAAAGPGPRPYADAAQIRRIHACGHEVASHSHRHEWLPGLGAAALAATVRDSRNALEQCIGAPVTTFVPPFNQPFDHGTAGAFSLSERRSGNRERADVTRLCECLAASGYRSCRISYAPVFQQAAERLLRRRFDRPGAVETVAGISCVRLNTPGGFDRPAVRMIERCARDGGIAVVYGHPHSIDRGGTQDRRALVPFLARAAELRDLGSLDVMLPRTLAAADTPATVVAAG
jgi:peptidoglycan/xylan/chitin deacetylase (PgdA/CDA1 family)